MNEELKKQVKTVITDVCYEAQSNGKSFIPDIVQRNSIKIEELIKRYQKQIK